MESKNSQVEKNYASLFETLKSQGVNIAPEYKAKIEERLNQVRNYEPKVGVFGKTGVGKSSLCNALFGQDVCKISDIKACTRTPQEVIVSIGGKGLKLLDVPGVGESIDRDKEYEELYENLLPKLDLIFWVFKADDRAEASDENFFKKLIRPYIDAGKPFLAVINQVDKVEPFREWSVEEKRPSAKQAANIDEKRKSIAGIFDLPLNKVLPISANEKYNLVELVDSIIHALPNEQKFIMLEKIKKAEEEQVEKLKAEADKAQAEADKAKAEAKRAMLEAEEARVKFEAEREKAKQESQREKVKAREEQARYEKEAQAQYEKIQAEVAKARSEEERARSEEERARAEAERARAEAERARIDTKISQKAIIDAEESLYTITAEIVAGVIIGVGSAVVDGCKYAWEGTKDIYSKVKKSKWNPKNW